MICSIILSRSLKGIRYKHIKRIINIVYLNAPWGAPLFYGVGKLAVLLLDHMAGRIDTAYTQTIGDINLIQVEPQGEIPA